MVLLREQRKARGRPAVEVVFHYTDGSNSSLALRYGQGTYRPDGDVRSRNLWSTAGFVILEQEVQGQDRPIQDRHLYRVELPSPKPEKTVDRVEIRTEVEGVEFLVAAATSLEHP